jgi:citrate synthase
MNMINMSRSIWLDSKEALGLLGIRPQTLYASVSRKRIRAKPDPNDPRRSLYHAGDVRHLAARGRGRPSKERVAAESISWGIPVLVSGISTVAHGRLWYRGEDAMQLADRESLERVAGLLWQSAPVLIPAKTLRNMRRSAAPGALEAAYCLLAPRVLSGGYPEALQRTSWPRVEIRARGMIVS